MKTTLTLSFLFLLLCFCPFHTLSQAADEIDAEKLLDQANYCYNDLEDYPRALDILKQVINSNTSVYYKAEARLQTAYVYFLMKKDVVDYKYEILEALKLDPQLSVSSAYKKKFQDIFNTIKNEPTASLQKLRQSTHTDSKKSGNKFFIKLKADMVSPLDKNFKQLYGSMYLLPKVSAGIRLTGNFFLWAGFASVTRNGIIEDSEEKAVTTQRFLFFGVSLLKKKAGKLGFKIDAAVTSIAYKEKAFDTEVKGTARGFDIETGVIYHAGKNFFSELTAGYLYASQIMTEGKVKFGGFKGGLGIGMKF